MGVKIWAAAGMGDWPNFVARPMGWPVCSRLRLIGFRVVARLPPSLDTPASAGHRSQTDAGPARDRARAAILPGSRSQEIRDNLPLMLEVMDQLRSEMDVSGVIVAADPRAAQQIESLNQSRYPVRTGDIDGVLAWSSFAFAVSGTVTLDVARHRRPGLGIYACGWAFRMIAKMLIRGWCCPRIWFLAVKPCRNLLPFQWIRDWCWMRCVLLNDDQALRVGAE